MRSDAFLSLRLFHQEDMMPTYPMLPGEYYHEEKELRVGFLHILMQFPLPDGAYLAGWDYQITLNSTNDMHADQFTAYELGMVWIPVYGEDQKQTFTEDEGIQYFYHMMPEIDDTDPTTAWTVTRRVLRGGDDVEDTNADNPNDLGVTGLLWQPDLFSTRFLTNPAEPAVLWKMREKIGFSRGTGYRTGSGTNTRAQRFITGRERSGLMAQMPGVLYFYLNNPHDIDESRYDDHDKTQPVDRQYQNLRFLAPDVQMLSGMSSTWPADEDDYRRWAKIYRIRTSEGVVPQPTRIWKQEALDISFEFHWHFARNPRALTLTPTITDSQQSDPPTS